jgi:hypothetical protein
VKTDGNRRLVLEYIAFYQAIALYKYSQDVSRANSGYTNEKAAQALALTFVNVAHLCHLLE